MNTLWYLPLERLAARYTGQLGDRWVPAAFAEVAGSGWRLQPLPAPDVSDQISVGVVLDAVQRGVVATTQVQALLARLPEIGDGDAVYLQDLWTPGFEALLYALHLTGKRPRLYARCWAQSVDEYDFTWPMRRWMRHFELGFTEPLAGLFVASTVHRDQLRAAGVTCQIHVTGLPFDRDEVAARVAVAPRLRQVASTSRLDAEKNPHFMLDVATAFLGRAKRWTWVVTSCADAWSSTAPGVLDRCATLERDTHGRFSMRCGLTKDQYYAELGRSAVQFNSALQDYVSFTMLEAATAGCELCYPRFRSFVECVPADRLYDPFRLESALSVLDAAAACGAAWPFAPGVCHAGLRAEIAVMLRGYSGPELNVWHHPPSFMAAVAGPLS